jgi:hypothetical protein
VGQRGRVSIPLEDHDGPGARAGDQPLVSPDFVELPDSDNVPVQSAAPGVARPVGDRIPRASAVDRLERVAVGRLALVEVLERPRYSASADVLDGLGYWR